MAPAIYGKPIEMENNHPPNGGPAILPNESKEDRSPVTLPCPVLDFLVKSRRNTRTNDSITHSKNRQENSRSPKVSGE